MSITRSAESLELKSMEMEELCKHLMNELEKHQLQHTLESRSDDELLIKVVRNPVFQTMLTIQRFRHRPLEVMVEVDYSKAKKSNDVIRTRVDSRDSWLTNGWLWVLLFFSGMIISSITLLGDKLDQLLISIQNEFSPLEIIAIFSVSSALIIVIGIYIIPKLMNEQKNRMKQFDATVLGIVKRRIKELNETQVSVKVTRCWSCFKQIDQEKVCPHCGEQQK